ncbi:ATP synthase subunit s, mitochondrial [Vanessa atalanta]|uniref:ATP synthase subunit s, mitochondrial n=1 Tax=Vanessa atalanta TaxID=42275 RepID=UPI001FCDB6E6|nr:ATP synthase subunit s, mitochondrial [Vanessa atalanta]
MFKLRPVINNLNDSFRSKAFPVRSFWEYVNMMFNKPDPERIKTLGPDRACAEWVLRNGGKIIWSDGKKLEDYNSLPPEEQSVPKIVTIDGSDSSISHYGFPHLSGCTMLEKIILHNNKYIDDRAMKGLSYGDATLKHAQVSECVNVTDVGLKDIKCLTKLNTLVLFNLSSVNNLDECKQYLQSQLPSCKILDREEQVKS